MASRPSDLEEAEAGVGRRDPGMGKNKQAAALRDQPGRTSARSINHRFRDGDMIQPSLRLPREERQGSAQPPHERVSPLGNAIFLGDDGVSQVLGEVVQLRETFELQMGVVESVISYVVMNVWDLSEGTTAGRVSGKNLLNGGSLIGLPRLPLDFTSRGKIQPAPRVTSDWLACSSVARPHGPSTRNKQEARHAGAPSSGTDDHP